MNLDNLFEMQKKLDKKIIERFPNLRDEDLLPKKILALQVEIGELCQEWRGFKFWSEDREPRTEVYSIDYLVLPDGTEIEQARNPLLEEYVDCLHFILSIGLELNKADNVSFVYNARLNSGVDEITDTFSYLFKNTWNVHADFYFLINGFIELGEMLGFTWEQIEQAYIQKNSVNHERQQNGY